MISSAFSFSLVSRLDDTVMLLVSMTLASFRRIMAVDAVAPTTVATCMRTWISHSPWPSHHFKRLSRGQMRALMERKKGAMMTHRISDPAAMLPCRNCHTSGGRQSIHDGKATTGRMMAWIPRGAKVPATLVPLTILGSMGSPADKLIVQSQQMRCCCGYEQRELDRMSDSDLNTPL
jgi:hypothetical protein